MEGQPVNSVNRRSNHPDGGGIGHFKPNAEKGVDLQGDMVAEVTEGTDLALILRNRGRDGLLCFSVDELAEIKCPMRCCWLEIYNIRLEGLLLEISNLNHSH